MCNFVALYYQHEANIVLFVSKKVGYDDVNKFIDLTAVVKELFEKTGFI